MDTSAEHIDRTEPLKLIDLWGQEHIQRKLLECKKNQVLCEEIAREMKEAGYERTYQQCRDKPGSQYDNRVLFCNVPFANVAIVYYERSL